MEHKHVHEELKFTHHQRKNYVPISYYQHVNAPSCYFEFSTGLLAVIPGASAAAAPIQAAIGSITSAIGILNGLPGVR